MNKFLKKLGIFLLGFIITLFGIYGFNRFTLFCSDYDFSNANILITGDSHAVFSLDPKLFSNAKNISLQSESYIYTYLKLKSIFSKCHIDTVFLTFSPHNLSSSYDFKFLNSQISKSLFNKYYPLFNIKVLKELNADLFHYTLAYTKNMLALPKTNHFNGFIGEFYPRHGVRLDSLRIKSAINRHYFHGNKQLNISKTMIAYLDSYCNI